MSHQVKAVKYMTDYSKEDLEDIADAESYILADSIKTKAKAIKDVL